MEFWKRLLIYTFVSVSVVVIYFFISSPTNPPDKLRVKFLSGDCIVHIKNTSENIDFLISSAESEKYRLIIYDHTGLPSILLADDPPYALTSYIDNFFKKVSCNLSNSAYLKNIKVGKDPLRSMRILLMHQDLKIIK